jgi:hypothetical protein
MAAAVQMPVSGSVTEKSTFAQIASNELLNIPLFKSSVVVNELTKKILSESFQPQNQDNVKFSFSNDSGQIEATFSSTGKLWGYKYHERRDGCDFDTELQTVEMIPSPSAECRTHIERLPRALWLRQNGYECAYRIGKFAVPVIAVGSSLWTDPRSVCGALMYGIGSEFAFKMLFPMMF